MTVEDTSSPSGPLAHPSPVGGSWTPLRIGILDRLRRDAPSLSELYEGAVLLVHQKTPGYVRFVSHAVREIGNRLPQVMVGVMAGSRLEYVNRLDEIARLFEDTGISHVSGRVHDQTVSGGTELPSDSGLTVSVPRRLYEKVESLILDHEKTRNRRKDNVQRLFEEFFPGNVDRGGAIRPVIAQWINITKWFMRLAHDNGRSDMDQDGNVFEKQFELFETTLGALLREFFSTMDGLDEILEDANS
jgi:hypothetical protein